MYAKEPVPTMVLKSNGTNLLQRELQDCLKVGKQVEQQDQLHS
jgi:hypothetical protein